MNEDQAQELFEKSGKLLIKLSQYLATLDPSVIEVSMACAVVSIHAAKNVHTNKKEYMKLIDQMWEDIQE